MAVSIEGSIAGKPITVCADQGAMTSLSCESLIKALGLMDRSKPLPIPITVKVGTGGFRLATKSIRLAFEMGGHTFTHTLLVVPDFSGLFLIGIDFFEGHYWTKPDGLEHYYVFDGYKRVKYEPHPLHLESDPVQVKTSRHLKIPVGCTVHALGVLDVPQAIEVKPGMEGIMRPARTSIDGLEIPYSVVKVYDYHGFRSRIILTNTSTHAIRIPKGTCVGVMSCSSFAGIVHVDIHSTTTTNQPESLPDQAFIDQLKTVDLSPDQVKQILDLLFEHRSTFAVNPKKPGLNHLITHHIDTGDAKPFKCRPFNYSPPEDEKIRQEVLALLELGIVRPSNSPWASNVVLAKRSDGSVRMCFDARRLNSVTKRDSFTLPRLKDLLRRFKGAQYFSVLDAASGYHGVPLSEESMEKTAFITRFGQ